MAQRHWRDRPSPNQLNPSQIQHLRTAFPRCKIEFIPITQLCPEAAPKGTQTERLLIQTLYKQIATGQNTTINTIATQLERSKGRLSQIARSLNPQGFKAIKKSLVLLYQALESKTKLSEVPEDIRVN